MSKLLWPMPMPIVVLSGKNESGKTLFATTANPIPSRTCVYDLEHSSTTYRIPGLVRVDVPDELRSKYGSNHRPVDLFQWMQADVRERVKPGLFDAVVIDPVSGELETGLADWVRANPKSFGATPTQYEQMSGLMWGHAKAYYKTWLSEIAACAQTLFLIVHMGREWSGKTPTGRLKAKGLETLHELASLYLELNRDVGPDGAKPQKPWANVKKSRLAHVVHVKKSEDDDGEWIPQAVLPPRLPEATPQWIRHFMTTPIDYDKLSKEYLAVPEHQSDEDKQHVRLQIAEAEAESARDRLALASAAVENRAAQAAQIQAASLAQAALMNARASEPAPAKVTAPISVPAFVLPPGSTVAPLTVASQPAPVPEPAPVQQTAAARDLPGMQPVLPGKLTVSMAATLEAFRGHLFTKGMDRPTWDGILAKRGAAGIDELTPPAALELIGKLQNILKAQGVPLEVDADGTLKS